MKFTIANCTEFFKDKSTDMLKHRLESVTSEIKLLENIYMTCGKAHWFSKEFNECAYSERQSLCQLSSALHSMLRERENLIN